MPQCHLKERCGYARTDLGFVYQKCSCPVGSNCVTSSSTDPLNGKMHQLFYNGTVYPSYCVSFQRTENGSNIPEMIAERSVPFDERFQIQRHQN